MGLTVRIRTKKDVFQLRLFLVNVFDTLLLLSLVSRSMQDSGLAGGASFDTLGTVQSKVLVIPKDREIVVAGACDTHRIVIITSHGCREVKLSLVEEQCKFLLFPPW